VLSGAKIGEGEGAGHREAFEEAEGVCVWESGSDGMSGVGGARGLCERSMWSTGVMAGVFADDVGLHTNRASGAMELVVQAAPIERE